jgi:very-short-patch-repair endonuclease
VIELDGGQHGESPMAVKDEIRTDQLKERGYNVIWFWNNEVLENMEGVLEVITSAALKTSDQLGDLSLTLS